MGIWRLLSKFTIACALLVGFEPLVFSHPFMDEIDFYTETIKKQMNPPGVSCLQVPTNHQFSVKAFCDNPLKSICEDVDQRESKEREHIFKAWEKINEKILPSVAKKFNLPQTTYEALIDPASYNKEFEKRRMISKEMNAQMDAAMTDYRSAFAGEIGKLLPGGSLEGFLQTLKSEMKAEVERQPLDSKTKMEMKKTLDDIKPVLSNDPWYCGEGGLSKNASLGGYYGENKRPVRTLIFCFGTLLSTLELGSVGNLTGRSDPIKLARIMTHELGHRIGLVHSGAFQKPTHTLITDAYEPFATCMRDKWSKYFIDPDDWIRYLEETLADQWGVEGWLSSVKKIGITDPTVLIEFLKDSVHEYCHESALGNDSHPGPGFRIGILFGQNPKVRALFGCQETEESKTFCPLFGGTFNANGPRFDYPALEKSYWDRKEKENDETKDLDRSKKK